MLHTADRMLTALTLLVSPNDTTQMVYE